MNKITPIRKLVFFLFLIFILLFFLWTRLSIVSIILVLIVESFTTKKIVQFLKQRLSKITFSILSYSYILLLPIGFAIFIRTFFFDIYFVPSSSMERTLFPNDYVLVNKIAYGTKIPKYVRDLPVIGSLLKKKNSAHQFDLYRPLKVFKPYEREDIVVFKSVEDNSKFLIKRIIGLPGETIKIEDARVHINNNILEEKKDYCYNYIESVSTTFKITKTLSNKEYNEFGYSEKQKLKKDIKESIASNLFLFPLSKQKQWTRDNYGGLIIPKKGLEIILDKTNFDIYKNIILYYENEMLSLNKNQSIAYTFKNNYYFMMGDNRHNSIDSRSYGFVPESYIQGKMTAKF